MLSDISIKDFLAETASKSPCPGGGSAAALSAAISASLSEMTANLSIGRKAFEAVEEDMKKTLEKASKLRDKLTEDIDRDSEAFNKVMSAFRLPKKSKEEKETRIKAVQEALKNAALVPLSVARDAFQIMEIGEFLIQHGNKNAVTDGAAGVMMARTAALAAIYNVKINLNSITDTDFVKKIFQEVSKLESEISVREKAILSHVNEFMALDK